MVHAPVAQKIKNLLLIYNKKIFPALKLISLTIKIVFCDKIEFGRQIIMDLYHDRFPGFVPALELNLKLSH